MIRQAFLIFFISDHSIKLHIDKGSGLKITSLLAQKRIGSSECFPECSFSLTILSTYLQVTVCKSVEILNNRGAYQSISNSIPVFHYEFDVHRRVFI
uniref:Uncharacterized protein n=1 Tax=Onchocerca volvulus TaxID=6282 RepID=A0A8R1TT81_ONCVO